MTIFIFNHRISNEQMIVEGQSIAEDQPIIWQGTPKQFKDTGFDESQIGGFELVDNKLVFSQNKWNEAQKQKLPIATGKGLIKFLEKQTKNQSKLEGLKLHEKAIKRTKFQNIFTKWKFTDTETGDLWAMFEQEEEFTQIEFDGLIAMIESTKALNNGNAVKTATINGVIALINEWKETVRFI